MSTKTSIEWARNDDGSEGRTWNPAVGCDKVSPGCDHCYAENIARRFAGGPGFPNGFEVTLKPERLADPLRWRQPTRVFVNSMSDLFHADIPDDYIAHVFAVMAAAPQHTYQILSKRHARMRSLLASAAFGEQVWQAFIEFGDFSFGGKNRIQPDHWAVAADRLGGNSGAPMRPLPNVHLGVSCEDQRLADIRIPALLETPAAVRFISAEPLLGPIDLYGPLVDGFHRPRLTYWLSGRPGWGPEQVGPTGLITQEPAVGPRLDWVICGAESGPGARPMDLDWVRTIRDQCEASGAAFFFKQAAENGKKIPTPELDGRTWTQMPQAVAA